MPFNTPTVVLNPPEERSRNQYGAGSLRGQRVAIVHDWLTTVAGSEKVLQQMLVLFPNADVFTLVDHLPAREHGFLNGTAVHTTFLQKLPFSAKLFRKLLWVLPSAIESLDLSGYDIVLSSSHAVAKGVLTGPDQLHICYCHSPMRYAWDLQHEYLRQSGLDRGLKSIYARATLHYLRLWDVRTAFGVDHFLANSTFVARRIKKVYGRESTVVHPPVDIDHFPMETHKSDYYLTASRLVPYKRVDLIIEAFARMPNRKLLVVGDGPEMAHCKNITQDNIQLMGYQEDKVLRALMGKAKAFVFAAQEDFGITVVEAQACGTPVICFNRGGALDSVIPDQTGVFFDCQSSDSIIDAVNRFEELAEPLDPHFIHAHAKQFSAEHFRFKLLKVIEKLWDEHATNMYRQIPALVMPKVLAVRA